jgi:hypothetical protein
MSAQVEEVLSEPAVAGSFALAIVVTSHAH